MRAEPFAVSRCSGTAVEQRYRAVERRLFTAHRIGGREHIIHLRRLGTRVRVHESGTGEPVLFLNGISAPGAGFAPLLPHVAGRQVVVDLPGHGLSDPYAWHRGSLRAQAVDAVTGVLDALRIERAALVANSLGGMIALWTALDSRDRVRALALLGEPAVALPGARGSVAMGLLTAPVAGRIFQWTMTLPAPRPAVRATMASAIGRPAARAASSDLLDLHALALRLPGRAHSFRVLLGRVLDGRSPRPELVLSDEELRRLALPVLFVWGDADGFLSPADGRASVERMPNARMEVVRGGHSPWLDDPAAVGAMIARFLDDAPS